MICQFCDRSRAVKLTTLKHIRLYVVLWGLISLLPFSHTPADSHGSPIAISIHFYSCSFLKKKKKKSLHLNSVRLFLAWILITVMYEVISTKIAAYHVSLMHQNICHYIMQYYANTWNMLQPCLRTISSFSLPCCWYSRSWQCNNTSAQYEQLTA